VSTRPRRYTRRTDLFLIRVWTDSKPDTGRPRGIMYGAPGDMGDFESTVDPSEEASAGDRKSLLDWSGTVKRVTDGEARHFSSLQNLLETLVAMISDANSRGVT
jgi:hypothetical protein